MIQHVLIVGAGWVGRQIAARMAQYGIDVWLVDRDVEVCRSALEWVRQLTPDNQPVQASGQMLDSGPDGFDFNWSHRVNMLEALQVFSGASRAKAPQIDMVLESVSEQVSSKKRVLREVSSLFPPPTIIASNSSYFVPSQLAGYVEHPSRFAHMHFHVPVLRESVVDIVGCRETENQVLQQLRQLAERIQQAPLMLRNEHPGYIFNWLLQSMLKSALELAVLDVADPEDIDYSWKAVTGMPLGPFGIMDQIGLDVIEQVLSNARWAAPSTVTSDQLLELLRQRTSQGHLGVKTQRGFYDYPASGE